MKRYTFTYAPWKKATVTVWAKTREDAVLKARNEMDRRYEKADREPPTSWNLNLVKESS